MSPTKQDQQLKNISILVVDDEQDTGEILSTFFTRYGATVRTAPNAREAYKAIQERQPTVIICDIAMPEENGIDFLRNLRNRATDQSEQIPAIAITAHTLDVHNWQAFCSGYLAYPPKPLNLPELLDTVIRLTWH